MVAALQAEADEDEAGDHEEFCNPDDAETGFGFEAALVAGHVAFGDEVVEPVASDLAEDGGDDWSEVEITCVECEYDVALFVGEMG